MTVGTPADYTGKIRDEIATVLIGRFDSLVAGGLADALSKNPHVRILGSDLEDAALEDAVVRQTPRVAILSEAVEYALLVRLKARQPETGVLILAEAPTRLLGTLLLAAGATCVTRNVSSAELFAAVRVAAQGVPMFFGVNGAQATGRGPREDLLTPREREVLEYLSRGQAYARIARALHIAPETVRTHTVSICTKLGVNSKRELIGWSRLATQAESSR
jgi:DNA-binding NarL/FixJ family response regulator